MRLLEAFSAIVNTASVRSVNCTQNRRGTWFGTKKLKRFSRSKKAAFSLQRKAGTSRAVAKGKPQSRGTSNLKDILFAIIEETTAQLNADRGTLFLNDPLTGELYSRVAQGDLTREIRILNNSGIAGSIFCSGIGEIIHDVQTDNRFDPTIDEQTGYTTKNIVCAPIRTVRNEIIGVIQILNKKKGRFTKQDLATVNAITEQAAVTLQNAQGLEQLAKARDKEMEFLDVVSEVTAEIELGALLQRVMVEATRMLNADRATLFLNDTRSNELFSRVAMGEGIGEIRLPNNVGIAGTVFQTKETVNIPHAYADLRFNPAFDKQSGYFTRSILCVPILNKDGECIGCTQVLNKVGGGFTDEDESRLKAFTQQVAIALENAKLFEDVTKSVHTITACWQACQMGNHD